ncbi:MAG TPA: 23S rRNA (uracil(1939)-C(5))-methyltransferase RlmD [Burkholderiales bacterium]|nr:23S rRNA (uracil(1939)-C(5))-methyltransferase RlmD [Burkholderiales bacterium]
METLESLKVESLDQEGRGVARRDGKAVFIEGALPGEVVTYSVFRKKPTFEIATLGKVIEESAARVAPRCRHFGLCGGCGLQHFEARAQLAVKQRVLEDSLWHIGRVRPERILPAIYGPAWEYRHRARLTVRYVQKKGGALVGFHEKKSSYVADMDSCEVLPQRISVLIRPLRELVSTLSIRSRLPQVEVSLGEGADVLVFRILEPLLPPDTELLRAFAQQHGVRVFLQPGGPDTAAPMSAADETDLYYALPEYDLKIRFAPTDFTQVNHAVNRVLVRRALTLLEPRPGERVADLFCGVGNFSLAIARSGAEVVGVEGSAELVRRATMNAQLNGLADSASFVERNLYRDVADPLAGLGRFDRMLIDPPRDGAMEVVRALPDEGPQRLVYVSCNPGTLARDAQLLTQVRGYRLEAAGVINMFPHTAHVESIAVFEKAN